MPFLLLDRASRLMPRQPEEFTFKGRDVDVTFGFYHDILETTPDIHLMAVARLLEVKLLG